MKRLFIAAALVCLTSCAHTQTPSSMERSERPKLPTPDSVLLQTERPSRVTAGDLPDYVTLHAEAVDMIRRLNERIGGWGEFYACVRQAVEMGTRCQPH